MTKLNITAARLRKLVPTLDERQFRMLCGSVLPSRPKSLDDQVTPDCKLMAYLYEWINHWGVFESGQIERTLDHLWRWLNSNKQKDIDTLSIVEKRYVTWSGSHLFYDSEANGFLEQLATPPVTHMTCSVRALVHEKETWLRRLRDEDE